MLIPFVISSGLLTRRPFKQPRAADTCGDASVSTTYYEGFSPSEKAHAFNTMAAFVNAGNLGQDWRILTPSFKAWDSPGQPSTTALWKLVNKATLEHIYLLSINGIIPARSGFTAIEIIAYAYPSQICGSVPLYSAAGPVDHWYTTNLIEHNQVLHLSGWTDDGIAAYVLPLDGTIFLFK